jgi:hypothetical protein
MNINPRWVVHMRLDRSRIFGDGEILPQRVFESRAEAEMFLDGTEYEFADSPLRKEVGWMHPVPVVDPDTSGGDIFSGPWLRGRLVFADTDTGLEPWRQRFETDWEDLAVDLVPEVMDELEKKGIIPSSPDARSPSVLTPDQQKQVQAELHQYGLPEIECSLSDKWEFRKIESDARRRLGSVNPNNSKNFLNRLLDAASDLETVLRNRRALTAVDVDHFWTSLEVYCHLAKFCRKRWQVEQSDDSPFEEARRQFCRALGGYVHEIRSTAKTDGNHPEALGDLASGVTKISASPSLPGQSQPDSNQGKVSDEFEPSETLGVPHPSGSRDERGPHSMEIADTSANREEESIDRTELKQNPRPNLDAREFPPSEPTRSFASKSSLPRREPHPNPETLFGTRAVQTFRIASDALGLTRRRLTDLIEEGRLEAIGVGPARRIVTASLRKYLGLPPKKLGRKRQ